MVEKQKYVVIGSNSFSGSTFIDLLLESHDCEVIGISRSPEYKNLFLPYAYKKKRSNRFHFYQMDLNKNMKEIIDLLDKEEPDAIVNFAAQGEVQHSWEYPEHWFQTNCLAVVNLSNRLKDKKYLKRYVHISTPEVYGSCEGNVPENFTYNPSTPYAASKVAGDLFLFTLVKNFSFPLIMIRSTNVYGKHQQLYRIIPRTIIYLKKGQKIELHGGGVAIKCFIHIRDVALGILKVIQFGRPGNIYHLSPERGYSISDVVRKICEKMGYDFKSSTIPVSERLGQDAKYVIDSTKARSELGWRPTISFDEGLDEVIRWIEENWEEIQKEPLEYIHKV